MSPTPLFGRSMENAFGAGLGSGPPAPANSGLPVGHATAIAIPLCTASLGWTSPTVGHCIPVNAVENAQPCQGGFSAISAIQWML